MSSNRDTVASFPRSAGSFAAVRPTQHSRTAADAMGRFLDRRCSFALRDDGTHLVAGR